MTVESDVVASWIRIESWLSKHAPGLAAGLNPAASAEAVARASGTFGIELPLEFEHSLARHDGQTRGSPEVFCEWEPLSLSGCIHTWRMLCSIADKGGFDVHDAAGKVPTEGPVRPLGWDRTRIPFASRGTGDYLTLDMDPAPGGSVGQIVTYRRGGIACEVVASGFASWLCQIANQFDAGVYAAFQDGNSLFLADE